MAEPTPNSAASPAEPSLEAAQKPSFKGFKWGDRPEQVWLARWIGAAALFLFLCSTARHLLLRSGAFDLGIYDQVVYLISQGLPPISSILGFHHMGNHAAWTVYLLAPLYRLYPSVYWLFAVQAISLALGMWPTWLLARQAGLSRSLANTMAIVYLLYPLIFNLNLFDFHPEVMALPALLGAIWAARANRLWLFSLLTVFALGCRDALSPTIAMMGVWLLLVEKRRFCGGFALVAGAGWFLLVTQWLIPLFKGGEEVAAVGRYAYLGDSVFDIMKNLLLKPGLVLGQVFRLETVDYLLKLTAPILWGLSLRHLTPLMVALPALAMNILSVEDTQRDLDHQYSLPILPFLLLAVISALAAKETWLQRRRWIILWSLVAFLLLQNNTFTTRQTLRALDSWPETQVALAQAQQNQEPILVDSYLTPHVTHRPFVRIADSKKLDTDLPQCNLVLLNLRLYRGTSRDRLEQVRQQIQADSAFQLTFNQGKVYLFTRKKG